MRTLHPPTQDCVNTKNIIYFKDGTNFNWWKKLIAYNGTSKAGHIAGEFINSKLSFLISVYFLWDVNGKWLVQKASVHRVFSTFPRVRTASEAY